MCNACLPFLLGRGKGGGREGREGDGVAIDTITRKMGVRADKDTTTIYTSPPEAPLFWNTYVCCLVCVWVCESVFVCVCLCALCLCRNCNVVMCARGLPVG